VGRKDHSWKYLRFWRGRVGVHTKVFQTEDVGQVAIIYNSDWSGITVVHWYEDSELVRVKLPEGVISSLRHLMAIDTLLKIGDAIDEGKIE